jgi:hypothetical protein
MASASSNAAANGAASDTDDDLALFALERQFNALTAELAASQGVSNRRATTCCSDARRSADGILHRPDPNLSDQDATRQAEALLARLYPVEQAIMATPALTIAGLGVKARHAAYVMSQYWTPPITEIDWHAKVVRLLIESVCSLANVPLPFRDPDEAEPPAKPVSDPNSLLP